MSTIYVNGTLQAVVAKCLFDKKILLSVMHNDIVFLCYVLTWLFFAKNGNFFNAMYFTISGELLSTAYHKEIVFDCYRSTKQTR